MLRLGIFSSMVVHFTIVVDCLWSLYLSLIKHIDMFEVGEDVELEMLLPTAQHIALVELLLYFIRYSSIHY